MNSSISFILFLDDSIQIILIWLLIYFLKTQNFVKQGYPLNNSEESIFLIKRIFKQGIFAQELTALIYFITFMNFNFRTFSKYLKNNFVYFIYF